ncbi:conserved hypothetical protein [Thiomonas sp. X19]|uniref:chemotaxis protein n=1 Tax=Thiomonas sp. X19 TaxID=1050370 RepID=UPI000B738F4A|nr:chemotaxis protein [Thiomonas sp. X19]SCC91632.1 conserved hypothetical protein [Thiomonas sp. X19]
MPASWLAALNTALPYLESLAKVALPVFGQRKQAKEAADASQQQLAELQTAVTRNAEHVRELALQLQQALGALEQAGVELAAAQRRQRWWSAAALALALLATVLAGYAVWR